jgi:hypothetical protein
MGFKAHETHGPRLGMIRPPGPSRLARALGSAAAPKGGRPREIESRPWEAEDPPVSRRTWERRKAAEVKG